MNDRAFRLDFFIAIGALVISALTAAALVYQTRVIADQYAATIWPYLSVSTTYSSNGEKIEISNDGVGPAIIQSAQLSVDGKNVQSWNDYFRALLSEPEVRTLLAHLVKVRHFPTISSSSVGISTTIRPGDSHTLLAISYPESLSMQALLQHKLALDFCYCSLNGSCWTLHATPAVQSRDTPQSVSHCATSAEIVSTPMFPSVRLRKKSP